MIEQTPRLGDYRQSESEQKGVTIGKRIADNKVEDLPAPIQYFNKLYLVDVSQYSIEFSIGRKLLAPTE